MKYIHFNYNFVDYFPHLVALSTAIFIGSIVLMLTKGINFGVDFRGGAEVQIKFAQSVAVDQFRADLEATQFKISSVQSIGEASDNEYLVKVQADDQTISKVTDTFQAMLNTKYADKGADIRKTDVVGPKAGSELRWAGFKAMLWSIIAIMIYVALRFEFKYAPGVVIALLHDVIITVGAFSLTGKEFTLQTVAAILAVIGYSVNDTVVVYDRIRENEMKYSGIDMKENINRSVNETLTRTMFTSATTLFVSATMLFLGGGVIHDFFFAITFGILVGTYSSIFVAAPMTLMLEKFKKAPANHGVSKTA